MKNRERILAVALAMSAFSLCGCAKPKVDFSTIKRPTRPAELSAYQVFVGAWTWEAELNNAEEPDRKWSGTANWEWTLDEHWLHGVITSKSERAAFDAAGAWGWNPKSNKYVWWMFNNWGYNQEGTAKYDEANKTWMMTYVSLGLDGTTSYGEYVMKVVDNDTLEWHNHEWADAFHTVEKMDMQGTYKRKS